MKYTTQAKTVAGVKKDIKNNKATYLIMERDHSVSLLIWDTSSDALKFINIEEDCRSYAEDEVGAIHCCLENPNIEFYKLEHISEIATFINQIRG